MKKLIFFIALVSISSSVFAQKNKKTSKTNTVIGLKMVDDLAKIMHGITAKEFKMKDNALYVNKGYQITKGNNGRIFIHSKDAKIAPDYKVTKQDDEQDVGSTDCCTVYYVCGGCSTVTTCLVMGVGNGHQCTSGCDMCLGYYTVVTRAPAAIEFMTSSGGF